MKKCGVGGNIAPLRRDSEGQSDITSFYSRCEILQHDIIRQKKRASENTNENKRIGVWSVDKHIDYIKSIVPNHTIINIDEDTFDTNLDILILHRVTGLYYDENFIARCKEMIKDTGFIFVIDNVQDNIHCYDQLYAYASMFGVNFPVEELVDIFTAANLQVHRMITLSPGVISLIMQKSSLV